MTLGQLVLAGDVKIVGVKYFFPWFHRKVNMAVNLCHNPSLLVMLSTGQMSQLRY